MIADITRLASKRLPLLPQRQVSTGPRTGAHLTAVSRQVSDLFYKCAVEIAKVVYRQLDVRLQNNSDFSKDHRHRMEDAKTILNEARNDVAESILPLFDIAVRGKEESLTDADLVARDYILRNVFDHMIRTFKAYSDSFAEESDVESLDKVIDKVATVQRDRLESWLVNYIFTAKVIETPAQATEAMKHKKLHR